METQTTYKYNIYNNNINNNNIYNTLLDTKGTSRISEYLLDELGRRKELSGKQIRNIQNCRRDHIAIECSKCSAYEVQIKRKGCGWKWCEHCGEKQGNRQRRRIIDILKTFSHRRMITLAFKNTYRMKREYIQRYRNQVGELVRKLKKSGFINKYIWFMEVKKVGFYWNYHIHMVYEGRYLPVRLLSRWFKGVTRGESFIVDIREIKGRNSAFFVGKYLSKYLTKFPLLRKKEDYLVWYLESKNLRMFQSSLKVSEFETKQKCEYCGGKLRLVTVIDFEGYERKILQDQDLEEVIISWVNNWFKDIGVPYDT